MMTRKIVIMILIIIMIMIVTFAEEETPKYVEDIKYVESIKDEDNHYSGDKGGDDDQHEEFRIVVKTLSVMKMIVLVSHQLMMMSRRMVTGGE